MLRVRLLGSFDLSLDGQSVNVVNTPRLQSVLAYLMLRCDNAQPRQQVASTFWPDASDAQARNNLRQTVHQLRQALPEVDRYLQADASTLRWCADATFSLDVAEYEHAAAHAKASYKAGDFFEAKIAWVRAATLYQGDLLPSCYDDWVAPERERLRQEFASLLKQLISLLEQQRDVGQAIATAQRLLVLDPLDEEAVLGLMKLHALNDDRASALRVYQACAKALQQELGIEPNSAVRELYERVLRTDTAPVKASARQRELDVPSPLIGRQPEWEQLQTVWQHAARHEAHMAVISGEAGIGKTRLAEELMLWASRQGIGVARTRAYAAEGRLSYAPVTEWLRSEAIHGALLGLDKVWLSEVARILPEILVERPDVQKPEGTTDQSQRQHLFEALARAVLVARQPLLLVVDDLQWCDQETLEWLRYLLRFDASAQILVIGTVRTEEVDAKHPLMRLLLDLRTANQLSEIELKRLDAAESAKLAGNILKRNVALSEATRLYKDTEGNPLFIVEMARGGLDTARQDSDEHADAPLKLPPRVLAMIQSRLAQLSEPARELMALGATIGRAFSVDVLTEASGANEEALLNSLDELWQRRIVRAQDGDTYDFTHDKLRDVAYAQLGPARQRLLHKRVGRAIEAVYASDLDAMSAQLAVQYERAGMVERAVAFYQQAAMVAKQRFANAEAVALSRRGLSLIPGMAPSSRRDEIELYFLTIFGITTHATSTFQMQGQYESLLRALELSDQLGKRLDPKPLRAVAYNQIIQNKFQAAQTIGERLLELGKQTEDRLVIAEAHQVIGVIHSWRGEFEQANRSFQLALHHYDLSRSSVHIEYFGWDLRVSSLCRFAQNLWCLGYLDKAFAAHQESFQHAVAHDTFGFAYSIYYKVWFHMVEGDLQAMQDQLAENIKYFEKQGLNYWLMLTRPYQGWCHATLYDRDSGIRQMENSMIEIRAFGTSTNFAVPAIILAQQYQMAARYTECLALITEVITECESAHNLWYISEAYRVRGDALCSSSIEAAESAYQQALTISHKQNAKFFELRAATSLARLWQSQGKLAEARHLLKPVYDWFTEVFDTHDLRVAKELLNQLKPIPDNAK